MKLCDVAIGEMVEVVKIFGEGELDIRLRSLGIDEGTRLKCVRISWNGESVIFECEGNLFSFRREAAKLIEVNKLF